MGDYGSIIIGLCETPHALTPNPLCIFWSKNLQSSLLRRPPRRSRYYLERKEGLETKKNPFIRDGTASTNLGSSYVRGPFLHGSQFLAGQHHSMSSSIHLLASIDTTTPVPIGTQLHKIRKNRAGDQGIHSIHLHCIAGVAVQPSTCM